MKPWERNILEYRPTLGFTPDIEGVVLSKPAGSAATYTPSGLAIQATQILASDLLDNTMASLSRATDILGKLKRCMSGDPAYAAYRAAKDAGDDTEARRIHLENMLNIEGNTQLDAVPILEDVADEMQAYLDYLNTELFEGQADFGDMDTVREAEEKMINTIFYRESTGKPVNYDKLVNRIRMIAAAMERVNTYQFTIDEAEANLLTGVKEVIDGDATGLLYYLSGVDDAHIPLMQQAVKLAFNDPAQQAANQIQNMDRAGDRDFRDLLDQKLSAVSKTFANVYEPLIPYYANDTMDNTGAESLRTILGRGIEAIATTFEQLTVDHMTNSFMNRSQIQALFANLTDKKKSQLLYRLLGTYADEFDPVDLDKEVKRFIKNQGLDSDGTLCG